MPPRFVSPGAMARNEMEAFLLRQAEDERREAALMFEAQRRQDEIALRREQEQRIAAERAEAQKNLEHEREFRRATTISQQAMEGDPTDPATAEMLRRQGYGGQVFTSQPTQGPLLGEDEAGVPQYQVTPGVLSLRGGANWINADLQRRSAAAIAAANQAAATDRSAASDEIRRLGVVAASDRAAAAADSRALRDQIAVDAERRAQEKADAEAAARRAADTQKDEAVAGYKRDVLQIVNSFLDPQGNLTPEVADVFGPLDARTPDIFPSTNTALSKLDRLIALLDINTLREMKAQSRTGASGMGALSAPELAILESAGTTLRNRKQRESDVAAELKRIRDSLVTTGAGGRAGESGGAVSVTAPNGTTYTFPTQEAANAFKAQAGIP